MNNCTPVEILNLVELQNKLEIVLCDIQNQVSDLYNLLTGEKPEEFKCSEILSFTDHSNNNLDKAMIIYRNVMNVYKCFKEV